MRSLSGFSSVCDFLLVGANLVLLFPHLAALDLLSSWIPLEVFHPGWQILGLEDNKSITVSKEASDILLLLFHFTLTKPVVNELGECEGFFLETIYFCLQVLNTNTDRE